MLVPGFPPLYNSNSKFKIILINLSALRSFCSPSVHYFIKTISFSSSPFADIEGGSELFSDWLFHANRSLEPELCGRDVYIRDNYCTDITQSQDIKKKKKTAKRKKNLPEEDLEQTEA